MPRFTFVISETGTPGRDPIIVELGAPEDARKEAIATLAALAKDALPDGDRHDFTASVSDEAGNELFEASLSLRSRWLDRR